jgi:hypothetical protein
VVFALPPQLPPTNLPQYLDLLGTRGDLNSSQCARQTYDTVLAKYHGWFTSKAIGAAMGMAPSREDIFLKLGLRAEPAMAIAEMIAVLSKVVGSIQAVLDRFDVDFPDKV